VSDGAPGPTPATPPPPPEPPPDTGPETPPIGVKPAARQDEKSVGELVFEISEQASILAREEIELAKTEISEKLNRLLAGSVAGLVAGVLLVAALILIMHGIAILLGDNLFGHRLWLGYLVEAVVFIVVAAGAGFYAYKSIRKSAPPMPEMAIQEAKEIRAALAPEDRE
jgi:uncharacterized membrane protein YqjE